MDKLIAELSKIVGPYVEYSIPNTLLSIRRENLQINI